MKISMIFVVGSFLSAYIITGLLQLVSSLLFVTYPRLSDGKKEWWNSRIYAIGMWLILPYIAILSIWVESTILQRFVTEVTLGYFIYDITIGVRYLGLHDMTLWAHHINTLVCFGYVTWFGGEELRITAWVVVVQTLSPLFHILWFMKESNRSFFQNDKKIVRLLLGMNFVGVVAPVCMWLIPQTDSIILRTGLFVQIVECVIWGIPLLLRLSNTKKNVDEK